MSSWNAQYQRSSSGGHPAPAHSGPGVSASGSAEGRYPSNYQPQAILQSSYAQHGQGYNPSNYESQYGNEYSSSHYAPHSYYQNESSFNGPSAGHHAAGTASPGARSGHGVVDPSAPEPFPPPSASPGARQMSHDIPGHHGYDQYYSGAHSSYGNYDGYSSQYGADAPQSASASSWNSAAQQKVPHSAPAHGGSSNGYSSYHNSSYNPPSQQYSNYGYPSGQPAQSYYNQSNNYLSGNPASAPQWNQPWSGGVNPQSMSGYSSTYNRGGAAPQPQALAAAAQAASQYPSGHTKASPGPLYGEGTMPPQAAQTSIAPQQTSTLPPSSLAAAPTSSVNPHAVSSNEYTGLGKRSADDSPKPVPVPTKKTKTVKKEEKPVPAEPPAPTKSHLKPPKQAHSAWQLFFTDRLNEAKATSQPSSKLNVAHVAKDAGELYKHIPAELKQHYAKRAEEARKEYHKQLEAWKATLTPEDIKQENAFRAGQRKAGKSRKGNMKDTNAPKKPLSAYFLFLKAIRTSGELTKRVFEGEGETTKQSMMAAKKWRSFDDEQKKPFLRQAEADKAEYETLKKQYEEDAAARLRGENPEHRSFVPSYAGDEVPHELLPAVIPNDVCDLETLLIRPSPDAHHHVKVSPSMATETIKPEPEHHHDDLADDLPTPSADPSHIPELTDFVKLEESAVPIEGL